jgi:hypothetical protein
MKHTPAPWHSDGVLIWAGDRVIAQADLAGVEYNEEIRQANACLISAAPDLLEACKDFVEMAETPHKDARLLIQRAKEAIKNAEGAPRG